MSAFSLHIYTSVTLPSKRYTMLQVHKYIYTSSPRSSPHKYLGKPHQTPYGQKVTLTIWSSTLYNSSRWVMFGLFDKLTLVFNELLKKKLVRNVIDVWHSLVVRGHNSVIVGFICAYTGGFLLIHCVSNIKNTGGLASHGVCKTSL